MMSRREMCSCELIVAASHRGVGVTVLMIRILCALICCASLVRESEQVSAPPINNDKIVSRITFGSCNRNQPPTNSRITIAARTVPHCVWLQTCVCVLTLCACVCGGDVCVVLLGQDRVQPLWRSLVNESSDLFVWLGDVVYGRCTHHCIAHHADVQSQRSRFLLTKFICLFDVCRSRQHLPRHRVPAISR